MKHIFIVNKISGKGSAYALVPLIKKVCEDNELDYVIEVTQYPGHIKEICQKYSDEKNMTIYSVGGDGTFFDVVNVAPKNTSVALIPAGSGNDFYRHFYGEKDVDENLILNTIKAKEIEVDIGAINDFKFANTNSIGIDAKINLDASAFIRKTFLNKSVAYILSIIMNVIILKPVTVDMTIDDKDYSGQYYVINCMNGSYYGNGVLSNPGGVVDDGMFEMVLFKKASRIKVYKALVAYLGGKANESHGVYRIKCRTFNIASKAEMPCQSDGENYMIKNIKGNLLDKYIKLKISD